MEIPFVDLQRQSEAIEAEALQAIQQVYRSGKYILGPQLEAFENEVSQYLQVPHALGVASGTDALFLSLKALGIGPGDEVITSPFSFIAATEMILAVGATPVFAEVNPENFSLEPASLEPVISPKAKAILAVHIFGAPVGLSEIQSLCKKNKLFFLEDGCQAFGASYHGKKVGSFGDLASFSFYPTKVLGGLGDGGMITTNNESLAKNIRALRHHGSKDGEEPKTLGCNSRLDEIQAAVLRIKLRQLDRWNQERIDLAEQYGEGLQGTQILTPNSSYGEGAIYQNYTIRAKNRDALREALKERGIETMIYYPQPIYQIPTVRDRLTPPGPKLPTAEKLCREVLSLPLYPGLTKEEVEKVTQVLCEFQK